MSNFEHRITEDSTEFEKEFLKIYDGNLWTALDKMKDWQPPKPLVVVPELTQKQADTLNDYKNGSGSLVNYLSTEIKKGDYDYFARTWLDGYTVEKEKKYILKHIDMSKLSADDSLYLAYGIYKKLLHVRYSKDVDMSKVKNCHFTQSEIDKLNIGSYEQIEVEP